MLPRIVNASGQEVARLNPSSLALDLNFSPLSTAVMTLPEGEPEPPVGTLIEIPTPRGSAGVFRVQQAEHTYQGDMRLHLEHGLVTLSDGLIPGTMEEPQQSTARAILGQILSHQSMWKLGTVEVPDSVVLSWFYDYSNLLESLLSVLDELPGYYASCDQSTVPWTLNVLAVDDIVQSECRLTRNIESLTVETDRSELCTRLYVVGLPAPLDADTIDQYDVIERSMTGDEGLSAEELTKAGQRYLEEHKHPALTVSINAVDLSEATGDSMDSFLLGALCRVCLPDYGQTINQRIVTLSWPDMVADESYVRLTLANKTQTTSDALAGLIIDTTIQRKMLVNQANEIDRLVVRTIANEEQINIIAPEINILAKEVEAKADLILLDAYVKITELETTNAKIDNLVNGLTQAMVLDALLVKGNQGEFAFLAANSFTLADRMAQWQTATVGNGVVNISQSKRFLNVMLADGTSESLDIVTNVSATGGQTSLNFLGYMSDS